jgi:CPA2 family monovalent cation:H+ antiporter-2
MLHSEIFNAFLITSVSLTIVSTLLTRARIHTIVGFILTGILIGPSGLNWIHSLPAANTISELGIILLMFSLGLEISLEHLKTMIKPLLRLGFVQVATTIFLTTLIFHIGFNYSLAKSIIFGACLALSSTAIVIKLLQTTRETETPHGRVTITILLLQDIAALPLMVMIPLLASNESLGSHPNDIWSVLFYISLFLSGCFLFGYYAVPRLFNEVVKTGSRELFFLMILSLTFIISFLAEKVGLSMSLGAFVAGVIISESPYNKQALAELAPLRDIFLGFFFASVGMLVDLKFLYEYFHHLLWLVPLLFLIKFSIIYLTVRLNRHSHGVSFASALGLAQIGEFSFILGASALTYNLISQQEFQYFLALAVFSLLFTPMMFSIAIKSSAHNGWPEFASYLKRRFYRREVIENSIQPLNVPLPEMIVGPRKALVIGLGHSGIKLLEAMKESGIPCLGIDFNMAHVTKVKSMGIDSQYGDATRPEVLEAAGIKEAYLVIISVTGKQLTSQILAVVHNLCPRVKIVLRVQFVQELNDIKLKEHDEVVVSEVEATSVLIEKVKAQYNLLAQN